MNNLEQRPYLVHRLLPAFKAEYEFPELTEGVGKDGSTESRSLIKKFCRFDYMGRAEFEFGAVPKAFVGLATLASQRVLIGCETKVMGKDVYVICRAPYHEAILDFLLKLAEPVAPNLMEPARFRDAVSGMNQYAIKPTPYTGGVCGWIDLDNLFMWFTSEPMYRAFVKFWGIPDSWEKFEAMTKGTK